MYENSYKCITGEEGPSLMGLEDIAMFRALPTATIFYPSDGVSTEKAVELAATTKVYKTKVQCCGFPTASVEHVFITKTAYLLSADCHVPLNKGCLLHPNQPPRQCHHL